MENIKNILDKLLLKEDKDLDLIKYYIKDIDLNKVLIKYHGDNLYTFIDNKNNLYYMIKDNIIILFNEIDEYDSDSDTDNEFNYKFFKKIDLNI